MKLSYRDAAPGDAPALSALARATFVDAFGHLYPRADLDAFLNETYAPEIQSSEIAAPDNQHRLAFEGDRLIAFAKAGAFKLPVAAPEPNVFELHRLYVAADAQGRGVGDVLMEWTLARARAAGATAIYLGVYHENHGAQRFYARYGFQSFATYIFNVGETRDPEFVLRLGL